MTLIFNPAAFKHGVTEEDVETAMATALLDERGNYADFD
jgi:hypothetical protein